MLTLPRLFYTGKVYKTVVRSDDKKTGGRSEEVKIFIRIRNEYI